jgi:hypothetical protein
MTFPGKFLFLLTLTVLIPGGAFLPSSGIGGMILFSLQVVEEESSLDSVGRMDGDSVPAECPEYSRDDNQPSNLGGDSSSQNTPTSSALHQTTQPLFSQAAIHLSLLYSDPRQPPPHLCQLFRPPRFLVFA